MLRERFIKTHFDLVDRFIAPSEFLRQRYIDWGIEHDRILVIENLLHHSTAQANAPVSTTAASSPSSDLPLRFAYFGQINHFKGCRHLARCAGAAAGSLARKGPTRHSRQCAREGSHASCNHAFGQSSTVLSDQATLHGPYRPEELASLMASTDWMVRAVTLVARTRRW